MLIIDFDCFILWFTCFAPMHRQGPFALSLSLSGSADLEQGKSLPLPFRGGDTVLLAPHVLDWWRNFAPSGAHRGEASTSLLHRIPPLFNQLVCFDPRVPHGVDRVSGVGGDPKRARVALHGWFQEPWPCVTAGGLHGIDGAEDEINDRISAALTADGTLEALPRCTGPLVVQLDCDAAGRVVPCAPLRVSFNSLEPDPAHADDPTHPDAARELILTKVEAVLRAVKLPSAPTGSSVTIPFVFE